MSHKKLVTGKGHDKNAVPVRRNIGHSLFSLQNDINRAFDDFFGLSLAPSRLMPDSAFMPKINISESDKEITVTAELPGIEEKDIDVSLTNKTLIIKGEKKSEKEEKSKNHYYIERSSGSFYREIPVSVGVAGDKVNATFTHGVLKVIMPKLPEAQRRTRSIPIKTG